MTREDCITYLALDKALMKEAMKDTPQEEQRRYMKKIIEAIDVVTEWIILDSVIESAKSDGQKEDHNEDE